MQKDLLAELHLPKLNIKSLENIVTQNSKRLACVIKENDEFIKNSKSIPPGLKVVVEGRFLDIDVNFPLSAPVENIEIIKRKYIIKKALRPLEISSKNGVDETFCSETAKPKSVQDSVKEDKIKTVEIRPLFTTKSDLNSTISPTAASLEACPVLTTETESLVDTVAKDDDAEVQILLDKSCLKYTDLSTKPLNSSRSLLKSNFKVTQSITESPAEGTLTSSTSDGVGECETSSDLAEDSAPAMCVISEVIGNAHTAFSEGDDTRENVYDIQENVYGTQQSSDDTQENVDVSQETQLITPKKTNDITKIKGWRRKQFFVEKATTIEFYSVSKGRRTLQKKIEIDNEKELDENPGNKENAFVCDSLDEFLDQDADLKIGYEVPHLFAEFGIKLTSDEIVSRPNLSEEDLEEVGTRYCVPISLPSDNTNLDDIKLEDIKVIKRPIEDDTRPYKLLKVEGCRRQSVKFMQKQAEKLETESPVNSSASEYNTDFQKNGCSLRRAYTDFSNIKLLSKLIALVVYPGPFRPLHPIVQYHLNKLRSYRTIVDGNWANFAASAVVSKHSHCKRRIVPAYCCVQVQKNLTETNEQTVKTEQKKVIKKPIKLKECRVILKRLKPSQITDPWCMKHNCYNCSACRLLSISPVGSEPETPPVQELQKNTKKREEGGGEEEEQGETVTVSPQASFNKKIARLLAKKVRLLKANGDTLTSIDSLRMIKHDTIEFIKLKFVKESFLTGYINIWYLKPETTAVRSRAFLTFSQTSPLSNAINLKSTGLCLNNLPKVITEMVSAENTFDSNEYAILHCNCGIWEIHGSLNITFGNSGKYVEQIFTSLELPELTALQEIAEKILNVKAVKWWVVDLTQKFKMIELKSGNHSTVIPRKRFLDLIRVNSFGFITLRQDYENRVLGAYVIQRLLPFILLGPYYLLETRNMILKGVSSTSTVPFQYYGEENVTSNYPLKFFINSVIKNFEKKKNKKLEGLWLYDKMCLDRTSYIEVVTSEVGNHTPDKDSVIDIEHGYSLNSLTNSSPSGTTSGIVRRKDGKNELQTVTVYLYFDIFELGYLEGELQFDNSVVINHPLDERTKMKSHKIGDWFLSIIRKRIVFIPTNLPVRWFVTKHKEDLRSRRPFNKFFLGGAHIVTKRGVFYLLELSESKIERLGLDKSEIIRVMSQCEVLNEVRELKRVAKLLMSESTRGLTMEGVLTQAVEKIKSLEEVKKNLENTRRLITKKKFKLAYRFLRLVNSLNIRMHLKMQIIENTEHLFIKENGELQEGFVKRLKLTRTGWNYFRRFERRRAGANKGRTKRLNVPTTVNELFQRGSSKSSGVDLLICSLKKLSQLNSVPKEPTVKALNASSDTTVTMKGPSPENQLKRKISDQFVKIMRPKILRNPIMVKQSSQVQDSEGKKMENTGLVVIPKSENNSTVKSDGFLKLNSSELPSNIKLCLNNWSINKLEVA